jgi:SAM-dependent methyltransferase
MSASSILDNKQKDIVLDLGCGKAKVCGAIGVDNVALPDVDIVHDLLDFPYPFESRTVETVYLRHVIEHFSFDDIRRILSEVHRVLRPGGVVHIRVPHAFCIAAWSDPTHRSSFTYGSARFFDASSPKAYYKETDSRWELIDTSSRVTWFNWKRYRMRRIDAFVSRYVAALLNWLLKKPTLPGSADLLVKALPLFFAEISWRLRKPETSYQMEREP